MKVYVVVNAEFYHETPEAHFYLRGVFTTWEQAVEQIEKEFNKTLEQRYKDYDDAVIERENWYLANSDDWDIVIEDKWDIQEMELDVAETEYVPVISI